MTPESLSEETASSPGDTCSISLKAALTSRGGLLLMDRELVLAQRALTRECIANFGKSLFTGNSVMRRSIPVREKVWVPESQIEQLSKQLLNNISFLRQASSASGLERFKLCVAYVVGCLYLSVVDQRKAFNPIIGECYEDRVVVEQNDSRAIMCIAGEQVANHPPRCFYTLHEDDEGYTIVGDAELSVGIGLNKVKITRAGANSICFTRRNPRRVVFEFPIFHLVGLLWGTRWGFFTGDFKICGHNCPPEASDQPDIINSLTRQTSNKDIRGQKGSACSYECTLKFQRSPNREKVVGYVLEHSTSKRLTVSGAWTSAITIGEDSFNVLTADPVICSVFAQKRLPMDGSLRGDLLMLQAGNIEEANRIKEELEVRQRQDRVLRAA